MNFENNGGFDYHPFNINFYHSTMELTENVLKECKWLPFKCIQFVHCTVKMSKVIISYYFELLLSLYFNHFALYVHSIQKYKLFSNNFKSWKSSFVWLQILSACIKVSFLVKCKSWMFQETFSWFLWLSKIESHHWCIILSSFIFS